MTNQTFAIVTVEFDAMHTAKQWDAQAAKEQPYKDIANRAAAIIRKARKDGKAPQFAITSNNDELLIIHDSRITFRNADFITPELKYIAAAVRNAIVEK